MKHRKYLFIIAGLIVLGLLLGNVLWYVDGFLVNRPISGWVMERYRISSGNGSAVSPEKPMVAGVFARERYEDTVQRAKELAEQTRMWEQEEDTFLEDCIAGMTLDKKLAQLMILTNDKDITAERLQTIQPGGIIFFGTDFKGRTVNEVRERVDMLQSCMEYPLLVGVDEEGGAVSRVSGLADEGLPLFRSARELGEEGGIKAVREETALKCRLLKSMGINVNFDPVADIVTDPKAYMYERSAGSSADDVAAYVSAVLREMKSENMISSLKHFPGYGNNGNTHRSDIRDERPLADYEASDFLPFVAGIEEGADMVMVSHIVMGAVDSDNPASLSLAVHKLLQEKMDFDGILIADDLNMKAVLGKMSLEEASGRALAAGNDMIFSADFEASMKGAEDALEAGIITEEQIDASVKRVLKMKLEHQLITAE